MTGVVCRYYVHYMQSYFYITTTGLCRTPTGSQVAWKVMRSDRGGEKPEGGEEGRTPLCGAACGAACGASELSPCWNQGASAAALVAANKDLPPLFSHGHVLSGGWKDELRGS